ncbi:MAG: hypothetical protein RSD57_18990 [Comamonas sp.]
MSEHNAQHKVLPRPKLRSATRVQPVSGSATATTEIEVTHGAVIPRTSPQPTSWTISIGIDETEKRASLALLEYVRDAKSDPEVQQSPKISKFLQELIGNLYNVLHDRTTDDAVAQIQKKNISANSSIAAKKKAELERKKPNPRREYVKKHWAAWIAKPDLYDTLEFFYEEMAKGIAEELKLEPPSKKSMQTWAKDWPLHPRAHQKKR